MRKSTKTRFLLLSAVAGMAIAGCKKENSPAAVKEASVTTPFMTNNQMNTSFATTTTLINFHNWTEDIANHNANPLTYDAGTITYTNNNYAVCTLNWQSSDPRAELSDDGLYMRNNTQVTIEGDFFLGKNASNATAVGAFFQSLIHNPGSVANLMLIATDATKFKFNTASPSNGDLYNLSLAKTSISTNIYNDWHHVKIMITNHSATQNGRLQCIIDNVYMTRSNGDNYVDTRTLGSTGAALKVGAYCMQNAKYHTGTTNVKNLYVTVTDI